MLSRGLLEQCRQEITCFCRCVPAFIKVYLLLESEPGRMLWLTSGQEHSFSYVKGDS
jgi:hypothetical protein